MRAYTCVCACARAQVWKGGREGREAPVILRQDDSWREREKGRERLPDRYCSAACKVINTVERRESSLLHVRYASNLLYPALRMRFELIGKGNKDIFFFI